VVALPKVAAAMTSREIGNLLPNNQRQFRTCLRDALRTVPRVGRSCEQFPDEFYLSFGVGWHRPDGSEAGALNFVGVEMARRIHALELPQVLRSVQHRRGDYGGNQAANKHCGEAHAAVARSHLPTAFPPMVMLRHQPKRLLATEVLSALGRPRLVPGDRLLKLPLPLAVRVDTQAVGPHGPQANKILDRGSCWSHVSVVRSSPASLSSR
jgi:hypothetical protein